MFTDNLVKLTFKIDCTAIRLCFCQICDVFVASLALEHALRCHATHWWQWIPRRPTFLLAISLGGIHTACNYAAYLTVLTPATKSTLPSCTRPYFARNSEWADS